MISIVIPCYNEALIIKDFVTQLNKTLQDINYDFEIIFVDNKSTDKTLNILSEQINVIKNCKIICLSNYFGKESAILAGLDFATGESSIIMDPDLEDPPELINQLITEWKNGNDVVYAIRKTSATTFSKLAARFSKGISPPMDFSN